MEKSVLNARKLGIKRNRARRLQEEVQRMANGLIVLNEWETLRRLIQDGCSLSRYGDGEIKHMDGRRNVSQVFRPTLQKRLWDAFRGRGDRYLVGVPYVFADREFTEVDAKYIQGMRRRFGKILERGHVYASSYISRGDLCGYLAWPSYWGLLQQLWLDRNVVLVRGHEKRANPNMILRTRSLSRVETPQSHAWDEYEGILERCLDYPVSYLFLLAVGPTASVLAWDLYRSGRQAVDIGHLGMFYRRLGIEDLTYRQVWNHRPTDPGYIKGVTDVE